MSLVNVQPMVCNRAVVQDEAYRAYTPVKIRQPVALSSNTHQLPRHEAQVAAYAETMCLAPNLEIRPRRDNCFFSDYDESPHL